jgi:hypothetical protein
MHNVEIATAWYRAIADLRPLQAEPIEFGDGHLLQSKITSKPAR